MRHLSCIKSEPLMTEYHKQKIELNKKQSALFETLARAKQPLGAYSLLDKLRDQGFSAPLQIYRTLDQLASLGLVHRLESLNAWTACCARHHKVTPIFAICNDCGHVTEHLDETLAQNIAAIPSKNGFLPDRSIIEIYGQCQDCTDN